MIVTTIEFDKGECDCLFIRLFPSMIKIMLMRLVMVYNDQAMFREVGHGIAMGNAVDVLKEKATYITDNFDQEGILKALYHENMLLKETCFVRKI